MKIRSGCGILIYSAGQGLITYKQVSFDSFSFLCTKLGQLVFIKKKKKNIKNPSKFMLVDENLQHSIDS